MTMNHPRLTAAIVDAENIKAALAANADAQAQARQLVQPAAALADTAKALEQQKVSLIARFLRAGRKPEQKELKEVEDKISAAQAGSQSVGAMLQAQAVVLAELEAEAVELRAREVAAAVDLQLARHGAAGAEVRALLPEVEKAAEALRTAYAQFLGAGRAHVMVAQQLSAAHPGARVEAVGWLGPLDQIRLHVPDLPAGIRIDAPELVLAAQAEALRRWSL